MTSKVPKKKKNEGFFFSATHPFVFDISLRKSFEFFISANMDYVQIYNQDSVIWMLIHLDVLIFLWLPS